jgi:hypothetical protein
MAPPTYIEAMQGFTTDGLTSVQALKKRATDWNWKLGAVLVGPYLDGNDLAACCLVSKDFKENFLPVLWSNPFLILKTKQKPFCKFGKRIRKRSWLTQNSEDSHVYAYCSRSFPGSAILGSNIRLESILPRE